jgi:acyl-CoA synthetase (AMP-forming)/AMP-acid ligase II
MWPGALAQKHPDKLATVMAATGEGVTYRQLDERSNQVARVLHDAGLRVGDRIALIAGNEQCFLEVCWGALRSGLYCTPVSTALTPREAVYIVSDSGARGLVASAAHAELAAAVRSLAGPLDVCLAAGRPVPGFTDYDRALQAVSPTPLARETEGAMLLYSSGTTGTPKGVMRPLSGLPAGSSNPLMPFMSRLDMDATATFLCPAPLYHAAPIGFSLTAHRVGATLVVMDRFDPVAFLSYVEQYRVTHTQLVPIMLIRLLALPDDTLRRFDLSSLRRVVHSAAPCPVEVKERLIEWLGPIVDEYYSGTEGSGITYITSPEWLEHRGSVGRAILGSIHILGTDGEELGAGKTGTVYFSGGYDYQYHGDAGATAARRSREGLTTLDDVGYVDGDGYLYLTDRRAHMIVSGGVNVYPQEAENIIAMHPDVADVAVIGVPDREFGEAVKAVVQLVDADRAGEAMAKDLIDYCRRRLAHYKCPRSVDFVSELPRSDTGKLRKSQLRDRYWVGHTTQIV